MQSTQIRSRFLEFFAHRGHRVIRSSPLVPQGDATLLFTNAGMNQFKDVFLGRETRDYRRAATSQKCVRAGGKHNDLENVGYTNRHLTFFEMLGNFSFGDYFKHDAIRFAWDLLTAGYGIAPERLSATVFENDDEAFALWRDEIGLSTTRIGRLGAKDNFWAMGDTGPCGPCSEIYYDTGRPGCGRDLCAAGCDCDRFVEIWNLVFMQFDRDREGTMTPLPAPSIDTGMGLERISMVLQGVGTVYETDLLRPLIDRAADVAGTRYGASADGDVALRVIADHLRSSTFLLADGILPENTGRGYVLRRIIRRALRFGKRVGFEGPFLHGLAGEVVACMGEAYPELPAGREHLVRVLRAEEERFQQTMVYAGKLFEEIVGRLEHEGVREIPGEDAFRLYDTFGLPLDTLKDMAEVRGLTVDESGFAAKLGATRAKGRESWKGGGAGSIGPVYQGLVSRAVSEFVGYADTRLEATQVLALLSDGREVAVANAGQVVEVVLARTPFYPEGGGQVGDRGLIRGESGAFAVVEDTVRPVTGLIVHRVAVRDGALHVGELVTAEVDAARRRNTAFNHSATHLLNAALRGVLGEHVKQAGSLVAPDRLRFDFTHFAKPEASEVRQIEELVNQRVNANDTVETAVMPIEEALERGALAFFGDKYGDEVRVVRMGAFSMELCGGTHVPATGNIGYFRVVSSGAVASGVRRVEAVTGDEAVLRALADRDLLEEVAGRLNVPRESLVEHVESLRRDLRDSKKEVSELRLKLASDGGRQGGGGDEFVAIGGARVAIRRVPDLDRAGLRSLADQLRARVGSGAVLLGTVRDGKVALLAAVTTDLVGKLDAGKLVRQMAEVVGGSGGGRKDIAEAGGSDETKLDEALSRGLEVVRGELASAG